MAWIAKNQLGRRNLPPFQRGELALAMEPWLKVKAKENQKGGGNKSEVGRTTLTEPITVRQKVEESARVSEGTLQKIKTILENADSETTEKARRGEMSIDKAYQQVKREKRDASLGTPEVLPNITGSETKYKTIYADPPWQYGNQSNSTRWRL